jgi:hypothetical protein
MADAGIISISPVDGLPATTRPNTFPDSKLRTTLPQSPGCKGNLTVALYAGANVQEPGNRTEAGVPDNIPSTNAALATCTTMAVSRGDNSMWS